MCCRAKSGSPKQALIFGERPSYFIVDSYARIILHIHAPIRRLLRAQHSVETRASSSAATCTTLCAGLRQPTRPDGGAASSGADAQFIAQHPVQASASSSTATCTAFSSGARKLTRPARALTANDGSKPCFIVDSYTHNISAGARQSTRPD